MPLKNLLGWSKSSLEFLCCIVRKNPNKLFGLLLHLPLATIPVPAHAFLKHFFTPRFSGRNRLMKGGLMEGDGWRS